MGKIILKIIWFGFGVFGAYSLIKPYLPQKSGFIQGVQGGLVSSQTQTINFPLTNLRNLEPQAVGEIISQTIKAEAEKIITSASQEVKTFPQKQIRKVKISTCEELLEEDICTVAKELSCQ